MNPEPLHRSWIDGIIRFSLQKKAIIFILLSVLVAWGVLVAPFDWGLGGPFRDRVPVDAIPDIGENQQIVFTQWIGRSPQDVEDQITYPLTVSLLGIPDVKTIRSTSMFGFSSVYVIFKDGVDFYWCRSRIIEKLNSLPEGTLPAGVQPALGPDATAMGQVFWYTLEGRDRGGKPAGGWDLHELRTIQDWYVRYALLSVEGVSEVASVGGFVQEYQVDLDPDRMRAYDVTLNEVIEAVKGANRDVGAQTIEVNRVEYLIRGLGFIKNLRDLEDAVIKLRDRVPIFVRTVARVSLGPAARQGALDKGGAECVGGVVVVRYGENPLKVIKAVREKIAEISPGLPRKSLPEGMMSQVQIVPFYDRTQLIGETLNTLNQTLSQEVMVTVIVVLVSMFHFGSSFMISGLLPLAVLLCFIAMKLFGVGANIVALTGIGIAIGTMVDMGVIFSENIHRHMQKAPATADRFKIVVDASREVWGAVLAAVSTTIVSFLPIFTMEGAEGKLFKPLAFTKTFALSASLVVALFVIPPLAHLVYSRRIRSARRGWVFYEGLIYLGVILIFFLGWKVGLMVSLAGFYNLLSPKTPKHAKAWVHALVRVAAGVGACLVLTDSWLPLGPEKGLTRNFSFVAALIGGVLLAFTLFQRYYARILDWCLSHKASFLCLPIGFTLFGLVVWQGFDPVFGWLPDFLKKSSFVSQMEGHFPGLGKEFMPPLDEGSFLFMPSTMPHASIGEVLDMLQIQDAAIKAIPEVETVVGKLGRAQSPLDPAPVSMIETLVTYRSEYLKNSGGELLRFRFDPEQRDFCRDMHGNILPAFDGKPYYVQGRFMRDEENRLVPDRDGNPFRLWRSGLDPALNPGRDAWRGIHAPDDIWASIVRAAQVPGTTSAAKLQPISARMVMLQSGIRASMGLRVTGPDLQTIQNAVLKIEELVREVPAVQPATVVADRIIGKPYLEVDIDRQAIGQYGITVERVLDVIDFAIGGRRITTTVEGRERYPVRVRYIRELRDEIETLGRVLVPAPDGSQIPLMQLADISYVKGPSGIRGENTFLVGYVLFDGKPQHAEVDVVEQVRDYLSEKLEYGEFELPAGVSYAFIGTYENHARAEKRLMIILPLALLIIFMIHYFHFASFVTAGLTFSSIIVAWSGGFIMIWLYGQSWFLDFSLFDTSMRDLFQVHPINLSVAVWVGFLALFGIAEDDGVVMATYLNETFSRRNPSTGREVREVTIEACLQRIRPCIMTTTTTLLSLIPVLTSSGRGADLMIPMAIPVFGGMILEGMTNLVVPVLYCAVQEFKLSRAESIEHRAAAITA
ncbi:MAG: efflux RND transporter permease subunit [Desulfobacteraceae bacterium]|nr:MAG: efflux RND transporter permease subunit [Desulfobacteraceae bacterium]